MMAWCTLTLCTQLNTHRGRGQPWGPLLCGMAGEGSWGLAEMGDGTLP